MSDRTLGYVFPQGTLSRALGGPSDAGPRPRTALMIGTALGTALLGLGSVSSPTMAACSPIGAGNQTATASDCAPNTGIDAIALGGSLTINLDADLDNTAGNGITGKATGATGTVALSPTGTRSVTGSTNGISLALDQDATIGLSNVTVNAKGGDAVSAISNTGSITVTGNASTDLKASQTGLGALTRNGNLSVNLAGTVNAGSYGIYASYLYGPGAISVTSSAAITSGSDGILAFHFYGESGDVTVKNSGVISAGGDGVSAQRFYGPGGVSVSNTAAITATGSGIVASRSFGDGNAEVTNSGVINASAYGITAALNSAEGDLKVTSTAAITSGSDGILASHSSGNGNATIFNSGSVSAATDGLSVQRISATGDASVTNSGVLTAGTNGILVTRTQGDGDASASNTAAISAGATGIFIDRSGGNGAAVVTNSGALTAAANGIEVAHFSGNGAVNVTSSAAITASGNGIYTRHFFGDGDLAVTNSGAISTDGVGIFAFHNTGTSTVTVDNSATVKAGEDGIYGSAFVGDGDVKVSNSGAVTSGGVGVTAARFNGDGALTLTNTGPVTAAGEGLSAQHFYGDGDLVVTTSGSISAGANGVFASHTDGDGDAKVAASGSIVASSNGIFAFHYTGKGDLTVTSNGSIVAGIDGIRADAAETVGDVRVTTGAQSSIVATNNGIYVREIQGFTGATVLTTGAGSTLTAGRDGIFATNEDKGVGNSLVITTGTNSQTLAKDTGLHAGGFDTANVSTGVGSALVGGLDSGATGNAIRLYDTGQAQVTIGSAASVIGAGTTADSAVIFSSTTLGTDITVYAGALVASRSLSVSGLAPAASDYAITAESGATQIANGGTLIGRVTLTDQADILTNSASWTTVGANTFGLGSDVVNNSGQVVTAVNGAIAETTSFNGLDHFRNAGVLSMVDNDKLSGTATRDSTIVNGIFVGQSGSRVAVDAFLGGPGSTSDTLIVRGRTDTGAAISGQTTLGQTQIYVNDVNRGPGALNQQGILVVDVQNGVTYGKGNSAGEPASFVIAPASPNYDPRFGGVIDKGMYFYELVTQPDGDGGTGHYLVSVRDGDGYEIASLMTGAQSIWHETAGLWLDRQVDLRSYLLNPSASGARTRVTKDSGIVKAPAGPTAQVTPGVWGKALGSWASREASSTYSAYGTNYNFDTGYTQNTYGFIAGVDFGKTTETGAVVFGILGGYINSQMTFNADSTKADYTGGTVGAYATYLNGGFFVDSLFKADFLSMDVSIPTMTSQGYVDQSPKVASLGVVIDSGYRFGSGTAWLEPLATFAYVNTSIDSMALMPGTSVAFQDGESVRGAVGARLGGRLFDTTGYWVEASATGRVWYEFAGNNAAFIYNPGLPFMANDTFDGTFGEFTGSFNWFSKENGLNSFVNGRIFFNNQYTAGSAVMGVRYQW